MSETLGNMEKLGSIDYSTDEQWTGKYWIDGKKIYQKTISCGAMPNATIKTVAHGISGISKVINIDGYAYMPSVANFSTLPLSSPAPINVYVDATYIYINSATDRSGMTESYITVQYTKTTS